MKTLYAATAAVFVLVMAHAVNNAPSAQTVANKPKAAQRVSVVASQQPRTLPGAVPEATIDNWAEVGDRLVKEKRYKEAYAAYMVRCNSSEGSNAYRMAGCNAGNDLRMAAKAHFVDTSDW